MSEFDIPTKYKTIKRGLVKLGLEYKHGSNHDVATCPKTNSKTTIPRTSELNKYTVGSICIFLIKNGYTKDEIKKAFKWK